MNPRIRLLLVIVVSASALLGTTAGLFLFFMTRDKADHKSAGKEMVSVPMQHFLSEAEAGHLSSGTIQYYLTTDLASVAAQARILEANANDHPRNDQKAKTWKSVGRLSSDNISMLRKHAFNETFSE